MKKKSDHAPTGAARSELSDSADWAEVRRQIKEKIVLEAWEMVLAAIKKAKAGNYQIMKYLFELAGLYPLEAGEKTDEDFSLSRMLCDRLGLPPAPESVEAEVIKVSENASERGNGHALK